jgi:lactate/malate dehydrogenase, NAD binding domain/Cytochrome C oxidase, cbb3-type, subunit III
MAVKIINGMWDMAPAVPRGDRARPPISSELWTGSGPSLGGAKPAEDRGFSVQVESERQMKAGIIGAGAVGSACLTALVGRRCAREIVVVDRDRKRARGLVTDVQYGAVLSPSVELREGDHGDLRGASLVMITAGVNEKTGGATDRNDAAGKLRLLDANVEVYKDIVPRLEAVASEAIVLVVTDPPDPGMQQGEAIYNERCAACHTAGGEGIAALFPRLNGAPWCNNRGPPA